MDEGMETRDVLDAAREPDESRMRELLAEVGGIKYVVETNVMLRIRLAELRTERDVRAAKAERLRQVAVHAQRWRNGPQDDIHQIHRLFVALDALITGDLAPASDHGRGGDE